MAKELIKTIGLKNKPIVISASVYRGKNYVDVRKNFLDQQGELVPTRKGLMLTSNQWNEIIDSFHEDFTIDAKGEGGNRNMILKTNDHQYAGIQVLFKNSLTEIIISNEFKSRLDKYSQEDILRVCFIAFTNILADYDEMEIMDKLCKMISVEI